MSRTVIRRVPRSSLQWAWPRTPTRRASERFGVEAGGDVEVGDGRAITADQGEYLVTIDLACRRLDESNRVVSPGAAPRLLGQALAHRDHLAIAAMAAGQDRLDRTRGPGGLLMLGHTGQPGPDRFFQVGTITAALEQTLIARANRLEPPVFDRLPGDDRAMHGVDSVELRGDFGRPG